MTGRIEKAILLTQLPVARSETPGQASFALKAREGAGDSLSASEYGDGARLIVVYPDLSTTVLSEGFHSASDPEISFDSSHVLFAGKKTGGDTWNIYEMKTDGSDVRRITNGIGNCRYPSYLPTLYTIVSPKPWYQITFVGAEPGAVSESGPGTATNLYSCRLDGTAVRRLTYNLSSDMDPCIMPDGRLLFASRQRSTLGRGQLGRVSLFGINIDGTDYAAFCTDEGKRMKRMPCVTAKGMAVFIEANTFARDGSGSLGCVELRRPLHSYRPITEEAHGFFHSPSPLPDGTILVSRRSRDESDTHAVYRLDPSTGQQEPVFDNPDCHDIQAKAVWPRPEPDGRSSVVRDDDPNGRLFCLDVRVTDLKRRQWLPSGTIKRLRVIEGIQPANGGLNTDKSSDRDSEPLLPKLMPRLAQRRILGEIDIEQDGSFNVEIPANTPIELQTLDANGMALRTCGWIWARNSEPRGCIGCHEDGELTPENLLVEAITRPSVQLTLPIRQRRTVDFRHDVMPIILAKCVKCHGKDGSAPHLANDPSAVIDSDGRARSAHGYERLLTSDSESGRGKYVHPGRARTSPLIWHIFGTNTSRQWDGTASEGPVAQMPPTPNEALTEDEKRSFVEWIDLGALWDGLARHEQRSGGSDR